MYDFPARSGYWIFWLLHILFREKHASSIRTISAKNVGWTLSCWRQCFTTDNVSQHPRLMSDEILPGKGEHLFRLEIFKTKFWEEIVFTYLSSAAVRICESVNTSMNTSTGCTCCLADLTDRDRLVTQPISLKHFITFRIFLWEGFGLVGKCCRYNCAANQGMNEEVYCIS